jgi:hypothetical protein
VTWNDAFRETHEMQSFEGMMEKCYSLRLELYNKVRFGKAQCPSA